MIFWHCTKKVPGKFETEDYKWQGAEYILYKSSAFFLFFFFALFYRVWLVCFLFFFSLVYWKKHATSGVHFLLWHFFVKDMLGLSVLRDDC